jgi:hypothetical protein
MEVAALQILDAAPLVARLRCELGLDLLGLYTETLGFVSSMTGESGPRGLGGSGS